MDYKHGHQELYLALPFSTFIKSFLFKIKNNMNIILLAWICFISDLLFFFLLEKWDKIYLNNPVYYLIYYSKVLDLKDAIHYSLWLIAKGWFFHIRPSLDGAFHWNNVQYSYIFQYTRPYSCSYLQIVCIVYLFYCTIVLVLFYCTIAEFRKSLRHAVTWNRRRNQTVNLKRESIPFVTETTASEA